MKLFDDATGHITQEGFSALLRGSLTEEESLEAAEHLAFCDACVARYAALLAEAPTLSPSRDLAPSILAKARRAARLLLARTSFQVGFAACLAGVFLAGAQLLPLPQNIGSFLPLPAPPATSYPLPPEAEAPPAREGPYETLNMKFAAAAEAFGQALGLA